MPNVSPDEVEVLAGRGSVHHDVADELTVHLVQRGAAQRAKRAKHVMEGKGPGATKPPACNPPPRTAHARRTGERDAPFASAQSQSMHGTRSMRGAKARTAPCFRTLQAVSKPKEMATSLFLRSPSIVLGTPMTLVGTPAGAEALQASVHFWMQLLTAKRWKQM